jgi:hypothetical protein
MKPLEVMAVRLRNAFEAAKVNHVNLTRVHGDPLKPAQFIESLDQLPAERFADSGEVTEDNPRGDVRRSKAAEMWLKIARIVIEQKLSPESFVNAQFVVLSPTSKPPFPTMLLGGQALSTYHEGRKLSQAAIVVSLECQIHHCQQQIAELKYSSLKVSGEDAWARVINDLSIELTALFRLCMASYVAAQPGTINRQRFVQLINQFRDAAAVQYCLDSEAYDRVWQNKIPANFKAEAEQIYRRIHGVTEEEFQ